MSGRGQLVVLGATARFGTRCMGYDPSQVPELEQPT